MPKTETKTVLKWCAWNRDGLCLRGPDIADESFDSLPEALRWVGEQLSEGMGHEYEVARGRYSLKAEGFVPSGDGEVITIDARGIDFADEGED